MNFNKSLEKKIKYTKDSCISDFTVQPTFKTMAIFGLIWYGGPNITYTKMDPKKIKLLLPTEYAL